MASPQFPGLPGWTRSDCLGCGQTVIAARHPHVVIGGRRDGSALFAIGVEADAILADDEEALFREELFVFGVAHRSCLPTARERLRRGDVDLPKDLPTAQGDEPDQFDEEYHRPPTGKFCPFCGSDQSLTVEHVWPRWVSRALRKHADAATHDKTFTISDSTGVRRRARTIDFEIPMCELCNNRWLSTLEQDVRPILEPMVLGRPRILNPAEQKLLATWAVKTALMLDLVTRDAAVIPMGYFREFYMLRAPLPSTQVWIGAYLGKRASLAWRNPLWIDVPSEEPPNANVTTFSVFRVVFQVAGHFVKAASFRDRRSQFGSAIHRIWPVAPASVRWPPRQSAFGDRSLADFAGSFNGHGAALAGKT